MPDQNAPLFDKLDPTRTRIRGALRKRPVVGTLIRHARGPLPSAFLRRALDVGLLEQSAALAFYATLSLAPLLLILLWLTASMPQLHDALLSQVGQLAGNDAGRVARTIISHAAQRPDTGSIAGWWSLLLLAVGASAVFAQLQETLNRIFRTDATHLAGIRYWLRKRLFSFGIIFSIGFLLLVSMTINTVLQLAFAHLPRLLPLAASVLTWLLYALGFALMYHYLPDRRVDWRRALTGGALTALLFVLGSLAIGWYLRQADPGSAYGSMGTLVVTLVWIYYAGLIVFVGATLTAVIDERARMPATGRHQASRAT